MMVSLKYENALGLGWDISQEKTFTERIFKEAETQGNFLI